MRNQNTKLHDGQETLPDSPSVERDRKAKALGKSGEQEAVEYLQKNDYLILKRNYRAGKHEIDIIAFKDDEIVVVEVKTRSGNNVIEPEEAVNHRKRQMIIWAADKYVSENNRQEPVRFDIISIIEGSEGHEIRHLKDAFNVMSY